MHNSKSKCRYNAKPSTYYFYVKTNISVHFQICISVPLSRSVITSTAGNISKHGNSNSCSKAEQIALPANSERIKA